MLISEMQEKQRRLDLFISDKKNLGFPYQDKYKDETKLALLVEIGELANATRCFKRWSNKGPEPKGRILDEVADCIHFLLKKLNFGKLIVKWEFMDLKGGDYVRSRTLNQLFNKAFYEATIEDWLETYKAIVNICLKMGYTKSEVEAAYLKKYQENFKRQENGY